MARLTDQQRRRGRATLARKRGVSEAGLTDFDVEDAVSSGTLTVEECGGDYVPAADTANYSYNHPGDTSPAYSPPSSSSSDSGSSSGGGGGGGD